MKGESLRKLAKELGVSASYLSQVKHGKRPASDRLIELLNISGKVLSNGANQKAKLNVKINEFECPQANSNRR